MTDTETDVVAVTLKPCPFCGMQPTLIDRGDDLFVFRCPEQSPCFGSGMATYGQRSRRASAIAAWNTRAALADQRDERGRVGLREALELVRAVRDMTRAENAHARATRRDEIAGRHRDATTSRDDVDMIHANLYTAWPARRLDALRAALAASSAPGIAARSPLSGDRT